MPIPIELVDQLIAYVESPYASNEAQAVYSKLLTEAMSPVEIREKLNMSESILVAEGRPLLEEVAKNMQDSLAQAQVADDLDWSARINESLAWLLESANIVVT